MPILQQRDEEAVRQRFDVELKRDVKMTLFTTRNVGGLYIPGRECKACGPTEELLQEVTALSPRVGLDVVDFYGSQETAREAGVDKVPALIVSSNGNDNARFYVHLQVFVTPTCQYCPSVARLAHAMAMESSHIVADVVEIQEFPSLANIYNVMSVPKTVINGSVQFAGAVTEEVFLSRIMTAIGVDEPTEEDDDQPSDETTPIR